MNVPNASLFDGRWSKIMNKHNKMIEARVHTNTNMNNNNNSNNNNKSSEEADNIDGDEAFAHLRGTKSHQDNYNSTQVYDKDWDRVILQHMRCRKPQCDTITNLSQNQEHNTAISKPLQVQWKIEEENSPEQNNTNVVQRCIGSQLLWLTILCYVLYELAQHIQPQIPQSPIEHDQ